MLFFKKKKKQNHQLDESFDKVLSEINNIDDKDNPKKIEHYILDSCEHIISTAKEVDAGNSQYKLLSDHISDIDKIMNMTTETKALIRELYENVYRLTKKKQNFKEQEKIIADEDFLMIQEHEDDIVSDIKRMEENERYKDRVSKDLRYLEGEKSRLEIEKSELKIKLGRSRIISVIVFFLTMIIVCTGLILPNDFTSNSRLILIVLMFLGVLAAFIVFLYVGRIRLEYRGIIKSLNQTINLVNVQRMKYVNINKALEYEKGIYEVTNSKELLLLWERYMRTVREQEAYRRNNLDLTYYVEKLFKVLKSLDLKFERKWAEQIDVITDTERINELLVKLSNKRALIKSQIESNSELILEERREIDALMKEHSFYVPEVMEIIRSVDRICKINTA